MKFLTSKHCKSEALAAKSSTSHDKRSSLSSSRAGTDVLNQRFNEYTYYRDWVLQEAFCFFAVLQNDLQPSFLGVDDVVLDLEGLQRKILSQHF